jgi:hypothetical protein
MRFPWIFVVLIAFSLTCSRAAVKTETNRTASFEPQSNEENQSDRNWIPDAVNSCLAMTKTPTPVVPENRINPFYLRGDLDGNEETDYVIIVKAQKNPQIRGMVICKDSRQSFLFGELAQSAKPFSDMSNDNFVGDNWEILTKPETKSIVTEGPDRKPLGNQAKGESVGFIFEGGGFFIYWNGKEFKGVGGV